MPEGDTIHRTARTLARALQGAAVTALATTVPQLRSWGPERLVGQTVAVVEPRGKHLLVWFAPVDVALHTHLGMSGSWHLYRPGERWRKPPQWARVTITVPDHVAVCFSAPTCELLSRRQVDHHRQLAGLGPDALAQVTDLAEARRRLDARAGWPVGEALLDQRVLAGVGNVYRCEVLFLHGVNPWTPVADVPAGARDGLLATAERLLRANAASGSARRVTTTRDAYLRPTDVDRTASTTRDADLRPTDVDLTASTTRDAYRWPADARAGGRLYVYGRSGRPCRRCGTPVRRSRLGPQARRVYWCPGCQPAAGPQTGEAPADAGARSDES